MCVFADIAVLNLTSQEINDILDGYNSQAATPLNITEFDSVLVTFRTLCQWESSTAPKQPISNQVSS